MNEIFSNIMFFALTVVVVAFSIGFIVALIYFIGILKNLKELSENAKKELQMLIKDINDFKSGIKMEVAIWQNVFGLGAGLVDKIGKLITHHSKNTPVKHRKIKSKKIKTAKKTP